MAFSSLGIGSGLDLNNLLKGLMSAEQRPLIALQKQEASHQARLSSLGTLKSSLSSLQTAANAMVPSSTQTAEEKFANIRATSSDTTTVNVTASTGAIAANYSISNTKLAQSEQIRKTETHLNIPATDGTLSIQVGSATAVNVSVTGGSSLSQVASAINNANAGVTAAVVNDGSQKHLLVTSNSSGQANQISITASDGAWSDFNYTPRGSFDPESPYAFNNWTEQAMAKSASMTLNGIAITSNTNTINSAIQGVSLTLLKENSGTLSIGVTKETSSNVSKALTDFVKAYNDLRVTTDNLGFYDPETKKAGALQGDATLRNTQSQIRSWLSTKAGGSSNFQLLSDLGVSVQKDGFLKLDSVKMNKAIQDDFAGVANLVAKVGVAFKNGLENTLGSNGTIKAASDSTSRLIQDVQKRQAQLNERLLNIEERYVKIFTALDSTIASMSSTGSYLTQQLENLPGAYNGRK